MLWGFVFGLAALTASLWAVAAGSHAFRRRHLPGWDGAPGILVSTILTMGAVTFVIQVLGAIGLFSAIPVAVALMGLGGTAWWHLRPETVLVDGSDLEEQPEDHSASSFTANRTRRPELAGIALVLGCAMVGAAWVARSAQGLSKLMDVESIRYRLPISARFVQDAQLTSIHIIDTVAGTLIAYYPHLSEAHHAVGMMFLRSEVAMTLINPALLALSLLAGWCIGRPFGVGAVSCLGALIMPATPLITHLHPGGATNDMMVIAMLMAAAAILLSADHLPTANPNVPIAIAGLAAGMGIATKYTLLPTFVALTLLVAIRASRGARVRALVVWSGAALAASWIWFVRNLMAVGNPVPPVELKIGSVGFSAVPDPYVSESMLIHLLDGEAWTSHLAPGLRLAWGPGWWVILLLTVVSVAAVLAWGATRLVKGLAVVSAVALVSYLAIPQPLGSEPGGLDVFHFNVRYMAHGASLSLALLATIPILSGRARHVLALGFLGVVAATQIDATIWDFTWISAEGYGGPVDGEYVRSGFLAALVITIAGLAWMWRPAGLRPPGRLITFAMAGLAVVALLASLVRAESYRRSEGLDSTVRVMFPSAVWVGEHDRVRIGLTGVPLHWYFLGGSLNNRVEYLVNTLPDGSFTALTTCEEYREAVNDTDLTHLITLRPGLFGGHPIERDWASTDPATTLVFDVESGPVFELTGDMDPASCPPPEALEE